MSDPVTGLTRAQLQAALQRIATVPVAVELLDGNGKRVSMVSPEFQPLVAATIVAARIIASEATP